jgi:hypothetical protein
VLLAFAQYHSVCPRGIETNGDAFCFLGNKGIVYYFACLAGYDLSLVEGGNGVSA